MKPARFFFLETSSQESKESEIDLKLTSAEVRSFEELADITRAHKEDKHFKWIPDLAIQIDQVWGQLLKAPTV